MTHQREDLTQAPADCPWRITPQGLVIRRDLTDGEFRALGQRIGALTNGLQWVIGDWLVYGEAAGQFGERYELAHEVTGKSYESLSQAFRVSEAFPIEQRVQGMSWTSHREALRLSPARRVQVLEQAHREGWNRMRLVGHITAVTSRGVEKALNAGKPLTTQQRKSALWRRKRKDYVQCPSCGHRFQRQRESSHVEPAAQDEQVAS